MIFWIKQKILSQVPLLNVIIPIGDSSLIGIPKNKTVGEVFEEMDADKNGRIMVKEIDPDMDAYVNSKKGKNLNLISHTFSRKNTGYGAMWLKKY